MAWRIDFTRNADKAMRKLDKGVAARVFDELDEIAKLEDPRSRGKASPSGSTSAESPTSPTRSTDRTHALPSALAIRLKNSDNSKSATSVRSHSPDLRSTDTFHFMASPSKPS